MGSIFEKERDLILQEYSADYKDDMASEMTVFLSITPEIHYEIQVRFANYPEPPQIILPTDLENELGEARRFLLGLRGWDTQNPPHIVEIIRELEDILQKIIFPSDEMEEVMREFNSHMIGPYTLHILLYSYKMKTFEFDIFHKKPNRPVLHFTSELQRILNVEELSLPSQWPRISLIDICREVSKKIDNRTRILDELKQLEDQKAFRRNIRRSLNQELILDVRVEIETGEFCDLEIRLNEEFPLAPPNIELKSLSNSEINQELNQLLIEQYNNWQNANTILEILEDVKNFIKRKSKQICQICHNYSCPRCHKPIFTKIAGISGENECKTQCNTCQATFHRCCWADQLKLTRKCPICLTQKTIFL